MSEEILLTFDGGTATKGQMLLYEYGRSQYAFSRILTTVEQYRRKKIVIQRVTPKQRVDLLVSAPFRGSFKLEVEVDTSQPAAVENIKFEQLFSLVLDRLIPPGEEFGELSTKLAKIKLAEIRRADRPDPFFSGIKFDQLSAVAEGDLYHEAIAADLMDWASRSDSRDIANSGITRSEIERAAIIIASDRKRKEVVEFVRSGISAADLDKLAAKIRPMFGELSVPLGKSAGRISIGAKSSENRYFIVDSERLAAISSRSLDEEEIEIDVKIKNFDVESGHGSMRISGEPGVRYFSIDPAQSEALKPRVVLSMNRRKVSLLCAKYTDSNGIVTSYQIRDVIEPLS